MTTRTERKEADAKAAQEAADREATERAEAQDALRRADYNLSRLLEECIAHARVSQRIPTVKERHDWCGERGATIHAIALAASTDCVPWIHEDDVFRPALVTDDDGTQQTKFCPEPLIDVLGALQWLHDEGVRQSEARAERERQERARDRALALADMSEDEFAAMIATRQKMEK